MLIFSLALTATALSPVECPRTTGPALVYPYGDDIPFDADLVLQWSQLGCSPAGPVHVRLLRDDQVVAMWTNVAPALARLGDHDLTPGSNYTLEWIRVSTSADVSDFLDGADAPSARGTRFTTAPRLATPARRVPHFDLEVLGREPAAHTLHTTLQATLDPDADLQDTVWQLADTWDGRVLAMGIGHADGIAVNGIPRDQDDICVQLRLSSVRGGAGMLVGDETCHEIGDGSGCSTVRAHPSLLWFAWPLVAWARRARARVPRADTH